MNAYDAKRREVCRIRIAGAFLTFTPISTIIVMYSGWAMLSQALIALVLLTVTCWGIKLLFTP